MWQHRSHWQTPHSLPNANNARRERIPTHCP
nr:MAG TPA: hypothetical protein [Caudoviricetes sp.]